MRGLALIAKWIMFAIAAIFMLAALLAEANCGPHWVEDVEVAIGGWIMRILRLGG